MLLRNSLTHYWQTTTHKGWVLLYLFSFCFKLMWRAVIHDLSKYGLTEARSFIPVIHLLKGTPYGGDEYKKLMEAIAPALVHHYWVNRHHPEHWKEGIDGMTLIDLVEMAFDWKASSKRHATGDPIKSVDINKKRFGYDDTMANILKNSLGREGGHAKIQNPVHGNDQH